ncbi:MAG: cadherin-like beta sandwich domain-containing protein [Coriobacteriia bacterium]|nr:cadherin-like beta sandwich domain-containing protein [Coriobacteriia bacterium]MCL2537229.1 cadherin-like beta sandwich domain-containing protein [Coriobacteriia bacterium]
MKRVINTRVTVLVLTALVSLCVLPGLAGAASTSPSISAGGSFSLAIDNEGKLWAWGQNVDGQLGDGTKVDKSLPTPIAEGITWKAVAAGSTHSVGIDTEGRLYTWGEDNWGSLGNGSKGGKSVSVPTQISQAHNWTKVTAGYKFGHAINDAGELWGWGNNYGAGIVGIGNASDDVYVPTRIGNRSDWLDVSDGNEFTVGLTADGKLYAWGKGGKGQTGPILTDKIAPAQIGSDTDWTAISAAGDSALALNSRGELYAWGSNHKGQLAVGKVSPSSSYVTEPARVASELNIKWEKIAAGGEFFTALDVQGNIYTWGVNDAAPIEGSEPVGRLGNGTNNDVMTPTRISAAGNWTEISTGTYFVIALNARGELFSWGVNSFGQLGLGTAGKGTNQLSPVRAAQNVSWNGSFPFIIDFHPGADELEIMSFTVQPGESLGGLPKIERKGFVFEGWFEDEAFTREVKPDTMPTGHSSYFAKWEADVAEDVPAPPKPIVPAPVPAPVVVKPAPKLSSNANLKDIKASAGSLNAKVNPATTSYVLQLNSYQASVVLTPIKADAMAKLQLKQNGKWVNASSASIKVAQGKSTKVEFRVVAQDGKTVKAYTVTVKRYKPAPKVKNTSTATAATASTASTTAKKATVAKKKAVAKKATAKKAAKPAAQTQAAVKSKTVYLGQPVAF